MEKIIKYNRQSNYDLVVQAYGSIDRLVKLCRDNSILDVDTNFNKEYVYDPNNIVNKKFTGYISKTDIPFEYKDTDAIRFINAVQSEGVVLTDTQKTAIIRLVSDLKGRYNPLYPTSNLWRKLIAVYIMIGGLDVTHRYNLKNPSTYRISWINDGNLPTHSYYGVQFLGGGYGETFLPCNKLFLNSHHISVYLRSNNISSYADGGSFNTVNNRGLLICGCSQYVPTEQAFVYSGTGRASFSNPSIDLNGFILGSRTSSSDLRIYKDGIQEGIDNTVSTLAWDSITMRLGDGSSLTGTHWKSNQEIAFASWGDGFNSTESYNYYKAVQQYQTVQGRQV